VHNSGISHSGVETTLRRLNLLLEEKPESNIPEMQSKRQYVTSFIRKCALCQKMALLKIPIQTRPFCISSYGFNTKIKYLYTVAYNILHQNLAIEIAQETQFKTTTTRIQNNRENTQRQDLI
jgi:hypothetical protein